MQTKSQIELSSEECLELGAVLKEIKQQHFYSARNVIGSLVAVLSILNLLFRGNLLDCSIPGSEYRISAFTILVSMLGLVFAWACLRGETIYRCLRFHENGISFLQAGEEIKLPYSQLQQYSFKKTRMYRDYQEGHCYGTNFELEFNSNSKHSIKWHSSNDDRQADRNSTDYDWLNGHLSRIVANNIAECIEMGKKIPWGQLALIQEAGLEIKKKTGLASELIFVPWSDLQAIQFRDGQLSLEIGKPQSSQSWNAIMHCDEANVFPGYLVIKRLLKSQTASAAIRYQSEDEISSAMASEYITPSPYCGV